MLTSLNSAAPFIAIYSAVFVVSKLLGLIPKLGFIKPIAGFASTSLVLNFPIRFGLERFYDTAIVSCFDIRHQYFSSDSRRMLQDRDAFSFTSFLFALLVMIGTLISVIVFLCYFCRKHPSKWGKRVTQLSDGVKTNKRWPTILSFLAFMTKRSILALNIVLFGIISPLTQIILLTVVLTITLLMTAVRNIFDSWYKYALNVLLELSCLALAISLFFYELLIDEENEALLVGRWFVLAQTGVQVMATAIILAETVHNLLACCCARKKREKQVVPDDSGDNSKTMITDSPLNFTGQKTSYALKTGNIDRSYGCYADEMVSQSAVKVAESRLKSVS